MVRGLNDDVVGLPPDPNLPLVGLPALPGLNPVVGLLALPGRLPTLGLRAEPGLYPVVGLKAVVGRPVIN